MYQNSNSNIGLFQYNLKENQSSKEAVDYIQLRLKDIGAQFYTYYVVECDIYQPLPTTSISKVTYLINHSDYPYTCFSILEPISYSNILLSDRSYELFFSKLANVAYSKKLSKLQCKGTSYKIRDFLIKVGIVTFGSNFKGILLEIEYLPCMIASNCAELIKELIVLLFGSNNHLSNMSSHLINRFHELYTPTDTIIQYLEFFNNFRKIAG